MKCVGDIFGPCQTKARITTTANAKEVEGLERVMNESESKRTGQAGATTCARLQRLLLQWWRNEESDERYLAAATDHADLERRQRALERMTAGPAVATFNH